MDVLRHTEHSRQGASKRLSRPEAATMTLALGICCVIRLRAKAECASRRVSQHTPQLIGRP